MIFKKMFIIINHLSKSITFRCEKSARNNSVSSTREFWDLRLKTKSWNFAEVRWRPYSPKESYLEDLIFKLPPSLGLGVLILKVIQIFYNGRYFFDIP